MLLKADAVQPAYDDLSRSLEAEPERHRRARRPAARRGLAQQDDRGRTAPDPTGRRSGDTAAKLALSRVLASQGNIEAATRIPMEMLQANPGDVPALEQLASILSDVGDAERLEPVVQRLVKEAPKSTWSHYYASSLFFLQNRHDMALQAARNAVSIDPSNAKAHNLVGACLASMGQTDAARTAFEASLKADPREPGTYTNLATLELQAGNRDRARKYFAEALTIDPTSQAARDGLEFNPLKCDPTLSIRSASTSVGARPQRRCVRSATFRESSSLENCDSPCRVVLRTSGTGIANCRHQEDYFDERRSHSGVLDAVVRMCRRSLPRRCQHARGQLRGRKRRRL